MIEQLSFTRGETIFSKLRPEVFNKYFPSGQIEKINVDKIPPVANDLFEYQNKQSLILPTDYELSDSYLHIHHSSYESTYVSHQTISQRIGTPVMTTNLIDLDKFGNEQGYGQITFYPTDKNPYFANKPFGSSLLTEINYRKKGLGQRRMLMMNALSIMLYDLPLYSEIVTPQAERILEKMLNESMVDKYVEPGRKDRYIFKR
jgi:hypothetical protein